MAAGKDGHRWTWSRTKRPVESKSGWVGSMVSKYGSGRDRPWLALSVKSGGTLVRYDHECVGHRKVRPQASSAVGGFDNGRARPLARTPPDDDGSGRGWPRAGTIKGGGARAEGHLWTCSAVVRDDR